MQRMLGLTAILALSVPALAQDGGGVDSPTSTTGMDAHGFKIVAFDGDVRDTLTVHRPGRMSPMEWYAGGLFEYAKRPLVQVIVPRDGSPTETVAALDNLVALNLATGLAVHERVRFDLALPLYFASTGLDDAQQGVGIGDIRVAAMVVALTPQDYDGFGFGVVPFLDVPSGNPSEFLGETGAAGGLKLAATYELESATLMADLGPTFRSAIDLENLNGADSFTLGLGGGYLINEASSINLETHLDAPFKKNAEGGTGTPWEAIVSYRQRHESGGFFTGGLAAGLTQGAGAAAFRLFVGGGFGVINDDTGPKDRDLDGILDKDDACPDEPETVNDFQDEDGCPDALSGLAVTVWYNDAAVNGADVKISGDGGTTSHQSSSTPIAKEVLPETTWEITATKGVCLAGDAKAVAKEGQTDVQVQLERVVAGKLTVKVVDEEGKPVPSAISWESESDESCVPAKPVRTGDDGITDAQDFGPGKHNLTVRAEGFRPAKQDVTVKQGDDKTIEVVLKAAKVKVTLEKIVILDKVYFELDKAIIKPESYGLLDEVAQVILDNPQIKKIEVAGHTDNQGPDAYNMTLSDNRANAVREYLVGKGVKGTMLIAKGYGETAPIASNKTTAGRADNRRVEFVILEQDTEVIKDATDAKDKQK